MTSYNYIIATGTCLEKDYKRLAHFSGNVNLEMTVD